MSSQPYPNPQAIFYQQYEAVRRDEVVGILLALFLGTFGLHHFYLRRTGLGILYCCFFWTGIPGFLGFIECFFMPGCGNRGHAGHPDAGMGSAGECDRERAARGAVGNAACLFPLRAYQSAGSALLLRMRSSAVNGL